jgi:hypothetical protein
LRFRVRVRGLGSGSGGWGEGVRGERLGMKSRMRAEGVEGEGANTIPVNARLAWEGSHTIIA